MLDVFNFANPQTANYQEFYGGGTTRDWMKPRGASMVRMLLIGAGAGGRVGNTSVGGTGGGSGAVTEWISCSPEESQTRTTSRPRARAESRNQGKRALSRLKPGENRRTGRQSGGRCRRRH